MRKKNDNFILIIYLLLFLMVASTLALLQPLADTPPLYGNPPDEHARFLVPWYIYQHGRIPTGFEEEVRIPAYGFSYALYNAFPYIVQGYAMRLVGVFTESKLILLYVARFINVFSGCGMAYVVYLLSQKLFLHRGFRWIFCFGIMFLPQNLFIHTYVNTDSMCMLAVAMMLYALVGAYKDGFRLKNRVWLCCGIILCALSYYNAYGYILSSILLFLGYFLNKQGGKWYYDWKEMLKQGISISAIVLLGIGWWFIRSYILYDGDILGFATREKMAIQYAIDEVNPLNMSTYETRGSSIWEMMQERDFLNGAFSSFIACFGSMAIYANIWIYRAYKLFLGCGLAACILLRGKLLQRDNSGRVTKAVKDADNQIKTGDVSESRGWYRTFFHANMIFCILMPLVLLIHYAYTMDYQNQGRYLLPALIPLMYYVTRGLEKLCKFCRLPDKMITVCTVLAALFPVICTLWMTYISSLPVYLQTGVVL